jgi:hypothetical protein
MSSFDPATVRQAVAEFTPLRPQKFQDLIPAKDVIIELRQRRASYRAIAVLLTQHCLPTSKTAIATFCHQILGEIVRPRRRPGRKRPASPVEPNGRMALPAQSEPAVDRPLQESLGPTHRASPNAQTTNHMKRLDLILNGKGGVGKSFFAVNFVQFLKDKGIAHVAIDSDNENSTLKRFHPDTRFLDLADRRGLDGIFTALEKSNLVVMDCRAASTDLFIDFFAEIDLPAVLSALGAALTLVMPVNHESDSVDQVQRLADQFGKKCGYVVVRNAAHSDSFVLFEAPKCARNSKTNSADGKLP